MKKFLLLFVMLAFTAMNAQTAPTVAPKAPATKQIAKKHVQNPAAYACVKCYNIEKGDAKCSKCGGDKVQLGTYYCAHCNKATGAKPGKCPTCQMATTQMTRKYCASKTGAVKAPKPMIKKAA